MYIHSRQAVGVTDRMQDAAAESEKMDLMTKMNKMRGTVEPLSWFNFVILKCLDAAGTTTRPFGFPRTCSRSKRVTDANRSNVAQCSLQHTRGGPSRLTDKVRSGEKREVMLRNSGGSLQRFDRYQSCHSYPTRARAKPLESSWSFPQTKGKVPYIFVLLPIRFQYSFYLIPRI